MERVRLLLLTAPIEKSQVSVKLARHGLAVAGLKLTRTREVPARESSSAEHPELTPRQTQVLRGMALGYRTKEISRRLRIAVKTVETYRQQLMQRLGIKHIPGLVRYALQMGIVPAAWLFE